MIEVVTISLAVAQLLIVLGGIIVASIKGIWTVGTDLALVQDRLDRLDEDQKEIRQSIILTAQRVDMVSREVQQLAQRVSRLEGRMNGDRK